MRFIMTEPDTQGFSTIHWVKRRTHHKQRPQWWNQTPFESLYDPDGPQYIHQDWSPVLMVEESLYRGKRGLNIKRQHMRARREADAKARRLEQQEADGDYEVKMFDRNFIQKMIQKRIELGKSQKEMAFMLNRPESLLAKFEKGELPFDGGLKSLLIWKLGL